MGVTYSDLHLGVVWRKGFMAAKNSREASLEETKVVPSERWQSAGLNHWHGMERKGQILKDSNQ